MHSVPPHHNDASGGAESRPCQHVRQVVPVVGHSAKGHDTAVQDAAECQEGAQHRPPPTCAPTRQVQLPAQVGRQVRGNGANGM